MRDPLAEPSDLIRSVSRALRVLEAVGRTPRGLTVKQIARRCELTVATTDPADETLAATLEGSITYTDELTPEAIEAGCAREPAATTTVFAVSAVRAAPAPAA